MNHWILQNVLLKSKGTDDTLRMRRIIGVHIFRLFKALFHLTWPVPASILYKSIAGRYRPVSYPDGPITARYRFVKNAYWGNSFILLSTKQTKPNTCAISVDPDENAHNEPSHQNI